ncbi:MAG TPA: amidohydrolase family protein [Planctomycetota bacterium]|nr:amidohydrolase family protein [Planctomycetota bacterium]
MSPISRREFMCRCAVAGGAAVAGASVRADEPPSKAIVDCHTHFYDPSRPQGVPWPGKNDKILYRRIMPDTFMAFAKKLGVTGTLVVEASPWVEDNQWVLDLCKAEPFLVGLVGNLTPGGADFGTQLTRFSADKHFRGIRINGGALVKGLADEKYLDDIKRLSDKDLELDINGGPNMLPNIVKLAEKLPELRIVINHCANVRIDGKAPPPDWVRDMQACAKYRNVFVKVSALVEGTGMSDGSAPADAGFYEPVLETLWNAFGEDRLIYGSNWPVSERFAPYERVQSIVAQYFKHKGQLAADRYFSLNAKKAYKWE